MIKIMTMSQQESSMLCGFVHYSSAVQMLELTEGSRVVYVSAVENQRWKDLEDDGQEQLR